MTVFLIAQQAALPGCLSAALLPAAMIGVFYLLVWRPQQKAMDDARRFKDSLKMDDLVITSGGIYGRITEVDKETVWLEIARGTKVRVARSQVVKYQDGETGTVIPEPEKSKK